MKKVLSITIALCLIFASVVPAYAEAWTPIQASNVTSAIQIISQILSNFWETSAASTQPSVLYTWQDFMYEFWRLSEFLIPRGSYQGQTNLWAIVEGTLPNILTYVSSWMTQNNSYLNSINNQFSGSLGYFGPTDYTPSGWNTWVNMWKIDRQGNLSSNSFYPQNTNLLGVLPWYLNNLTNNVAMGFIAQFDRYSDTKNGWLGKHYGDNLTTWDSQGDTLQQVAFTPESAIQGLYRYLAFTQRDVARLTYVFASDEEIETREKARETQTAVMDDFVDPDGAASASTDDFGSISDASAGVQTHFDTGVSAGGVWNVFDRNYDWFSQETADNLAYTPNRSTRMLKSSDDSEYETPYLDSYYEELHEIIGF